MAFWTVFQKDLRLELRTRESLSTMVVFAAAVILLFAFAFEAAPARFQSFTPGLMWMTYFFTAVLGLLRSFGQEKELEAYSLLLSAPVDRSAIFAGKTMAFFIFLLLAQAVSLPLFALFLHLPLLAAPAYLIGILILADLGIAVVGVLISGMSLRSPAGETLLPILLFPLLTPLLIAASKATHAALNGRPVSEWDVWLMLMVSYLVLFAVAGTFTFDYISEQ
ncbi:MAG: heme exporter protein CcmB [Fidelibacterota bacterium]|nr:MAG: heme exporter protein CcmB [Candidatus Neomarinimicrobiota bacterium]